VTTLMPEPRVPIDHPLRRAGRPAGLLARALAAAGALLAGAAVAVGLLAAPAAAQPPTRDTSGVMLTGGGQPCSYDACVLRVEETWFGRKVVRGPEGALVARLGLGGPSLANVVVGSDSAVYHARLYERAQTTGTVLTLIGTLGSVASLIAYSQREPEDDLRSEVIAVNVGALVVGIVGTSFQYKARRELSRSLWWFNRNALGAR